MTSIAPFFMQTLSVIGFCILGVAGVTGDVHTTPQGYAVEVVGWDQGVALPPFGYYGSQARNPEWAMHHEQYHLMQYRDQPEGFYLSVGLFSVGIHLFGWPVPLFEFEANWYAFEMIYG